MRWMVAFAAPLLAALALGPAPSPAAKPGGSETVSEGVQAYSQRDYARARRLLEPTAQAGNPRAQFYLARMHSWGHGGPRDEVAASRLYLRAARNGYARAQPIIAARYMDGIGVARNLVAAYRWLTIAAEGGNRQARKLRDQVLTGQMTGDELRRAQGKGDELP